MKGFDRIRPGTSGQCFYGTAEELWDTANTQPCLFAMELAAAEVLKAHRILPDAVAGCLGDQDIFFEMVAVAGGRVIPLEVSGGFHSPLMAAASARFRRTVRQAETGTTNVYSAFLVLFMLP